MVHQPNIPEDFNGKKDLRDLKIFGEYKESLDDLKDYVDSRKLSLEEEIEGTLHESVRNAKDCLERIHETLEPKFEKIVLMKMGDIEQKVNAWKEESSAQLREKIKKESEEQVRNLEVGIEAKFCAKLESLAEETSKATKAKLETEIHSHLQEVRKRQTLLAIVTVTLFLVLALINVVARF